ncbi:NADH:flavin oxidoreductase/NADH oxidase [Variovorax sp. J31P207]|uniref:NADH:flavin oxidoreductase/NADH oxidase n=1 Tax=Variovorax sp. J31P207 TaxID=3053510 RepID=UPI0025757B07|nr:NADH:flavin oxidoreductase/NADH oxidase [Variovorax sp. J31P207]MDM0071432.1 NADH:flavin oxidoreductase/NADH oxidase [Variovorax sp. J31P207]
MRSTKLFSSLSIRGLSLNNRVVASPMWQYAGQNFEPNDWHLMNMGRLAGGGAGLVFQEGTTVERRGCGTLGDIGLWHDDCMPLYRRMVALVKACGSVPGIQLMHAGPKARQLPPTTGRGPLERSAAIVDWDSWEPIGPSAISLNDNLPIPRAMTMVDIASVTEAFISSARRADSAGYEVLEIHAAHGYLLHAFLSPLTNKRTDAYGGSFEGRVRLVMEVVDGVRTVWPQEKPLFIRLSCIDGPAEGWSIEDTFKLVRLLRQHGVDLVDCSSGGIIGNPLPTQSARYGYQAPFAEAVRQETGALTSAVGLIVDPRHAEQLLAEQKADLIFIGRELIYNPNWPMDAARKLGDPKGFSVMPHRGAYWLERRASSMPDFLPSTYYQRETP